MFPEIMIRIKNRISTYNEKDYKFFRNILTKFTNTKKDYLLSLLKIFIFKIWILALIWEKLILYKRYEKVQYTYWKC